MNSPELIRANFHDFLRLIRPKLISDGGPVCATIVAIDHLTCNLTTMVFVLPKNYIDRCFPYLFDSPGSSYFEWLTKASALLDSGGFMKMELKANNLRKKDIPLWLLNFHGSDAYSNPNEDLGYGCSTVMIPSDLVIPAYTFLQRWFEQLSEHMFLMCSPEDASRYSSSEFSYGTDYDLLCIPFLRGKTFERWHGLDGLLPRLQRKVVEIEAGATRELNMHPVHLALGASLTSGRDIFFSKHTKDWVDEFALENGDINRPMNLATLDLIYCLQCRLVRLLEWPQHYANAKVKLETERSFTATHPMTKSLPYDPYLELSEYLSLMQSRYPILEELPYSSDAFLQQPKARSH